MREHTTISILLTINDSITFLKQYILGVSINCSRFILYLKMTVSFRYLVAVLWSPSILPLQLDLLFSVDCTRQVISEDSLHSCSLLFPRSMVPFLPLLPFQGTTNCCHDKAGVDGNGFWDPPCLLRN